MTEDLFYYFKESSKREARLHEIQKSMDDPKLTIKEIHSIRWLSYFNALTAVWRCLDSQLTYLAEASDKDSKAIGLKKKIATDSFIETTYMMMDAMTPLTVLSHCFQKENIDIALVKISQDICKDELWKVCSMETPYLKMLTEDLKGLDFKEQRVTTTIFNLKNMAQVFVQNMFENLVSRFPNDELFVSFGILGLKPIGSMNKSEVDTYGLEAMETLLDYYGKPKCVTWKSDTSVLSEARSQPIVNPSETKTE